MADKSRILIVDDDPVLLKMAAELLDGVYDVSLASSGEAALRLLARMDMPDLILLDIDMPGIDGYTDLSEIRKLHGGPAVPVVYLTGLTGSKSELRALQAGARAA